MCDHAVVQDNLSDYPVLKDLLPEDYSYHVCCFESLGDSNSFRTHLKLRLTREDEVQKWQEDFQASSGLTWRKSKTYPDTGDGSNKYRVDLRCHHHTRSTAAKTSKNTSCLAFMYLILKRQTYSKGRKSRSEDPHIKEGYYFHVVMKNNHNHLVCCAAALAKRDVSKETREKLERLFLSGHSPASALNALKSDLQEQEGSNYCLAAADRSVCPDRDYCYRLYRKLFKDACGAADGDGDGDGGGGGEMLSDLQKRLAAYEDRDPDRGRGRGEVCASIARTDRAAQAMWRWLGSPAHGVPRGHRAQLMRSFQLLMYSETAASLAENYRLLAEEPVARGHPGFLQHLAQVYGGRGDWAVCLQSFPADELNDVVPLPAGGGGGGGGGGSGGGGEALEDQLERVFKSLALKLRADPAFVGPLTSFVASYDQMTADAALRSALSAFGKSPEARATAGYQRPKWYVQTAAAQTPAAQTPAAQTPLQPTAGERRKEPSGRPTKASRKNPPYKRTGGKPAAPQSVALCGGLTVGGALCGGADGPLGGTP